MIRVDKARYPPCLWSTEVASENVTVGTAALTLTNGPLQSLQYNPISQRHVRQRPIVDAYTSSSILLHIQILKRKTKINISMSVVRPDGPLVNCPTFGALSSYEPPTKPLKASNHRGKSYSNN